MSTSFMSVIFWLYHIWFWDSILIGWIKKRSWLYILKVWVQVKYSTKYNLILEWAKGFFLQQPSLHNWWNRETDILGYASIWAWKWMYFKSYFIEDAQKATLNAHLLHLKRGEISKFYLSLFLTRIYSLKYSSLIGKLVKQGDMVK